MNWLCASTMENYLVFGDLIGNWYFPLRVGATIDFFEAFFRPKSCHSKSAITFFVDHLWPNGFLCLIEQARNCPFGFPDDRYRHVRLRHKLLRNRKKWKSFNPFSEKGMNAGLIRIALNYSLISILVNRQSVLALFILYWDLETIFWIFLRNFGLFFA